jgi:hypothetical protein
VGIPTHKSYSFEKCEPSYAIIIVGHFCKRVTICVSFLEQYIREERSPLKIFNDLQILSEVI